MLHIWMTHLLIQEEVMHHFIVLGGPRGGGGTPYNGLYREAPPKSSTFFRLQVYERVGESVIWVCEKAQKG